MGIRVKNKPDGLLGNRKFVPAAGSLQAERKTWGLS